MDDLKNKTVFVGPGTIRSKVAIPSSKSLCHRAILSAALAEGTSHISNVSLSKDIEATLAIAKAIGASITSTEDGFEICGIGGNGLRPSSDEPIVIDCAESGSTLRFTVPILSVLQIKATFIGHGKLPSRPMDIYYDLFEQKGIRYQTDNGKLPLTVEGALPCGRYEIDGGVSSQFITGLLMAMPMAKPMAKPKAMPMASDTDGSTIVVTGKFESKPYVQLTLDVLESFGITVIRKSEREFFIPAGQTYRAVDYSVEADASQAAFMITAGLIAAEEEGLLIPNLRKETAQGDIAFLQAVTAMNGRFCWCDQGLKVYPTNLFGDVVFNAEQCPDIVPILAVMASYCNGICTITHAERLRIKESDRLQTTFEELTKVGVKIKQTTDGLIIDGRKPEGSFENESDQQNTVMMTDGHNDHRIAMSLAIFALASEHGLFIRDAACVTKSWPSFFEDLSKASNARIETITSKE